MQEPAPSLARPSGTLDHIAMAAMRCSALLMESGARSKVVQEFAAAATRAMGAEFHGFRIGYASLAITVGHDGGTVTRMIAFGTPGVNHRLDQALRALARRAQAEGITVEAFSAEITRLQKETPRYAPLVTATCRPETLRVGPIRRKHE